MDKLQRFSFETIDDWVFDGTDEVCVERYEMFPRDDGKWVRYADVVDAWNAANAPADPELLALAKLGGVDLSRYRSVLPMAPAGQARADSERALARFGAYVVRDWFRRTSGFQSADGFQLDEGALGTGVVMRGATVGYRHAPGIADAIAALLAPDGAASEGVTG